MRRTARVEEWQSRQRRLSRLTRSRLTLQLALSLHAALLCAACGPDLPGEVVGTYTVSMHLGDNSCGKPALPVADGTNYAVELRADGERGYWRRPKIPPIEGHYDGDGGFAFTFEALFDIGDPDAGTAGCRLYRDEVLNGRVVIASDAGTADDAGDTGTTSDAATAASPPEPALSGQYTYTFRTDTSGICANNPGPLGVYQRLPCSVSYSLSGQDHKPF